MQEFVTKWDERAKNTNQEIFSSPVISSTNDFFGEYIAPLFVRKKVYILCSGWRRKADSLDWIDYKKRLKEPSLILLKSREGYETMNKFLREKLNPYLQNLIDSFSKINSLTEFNQWLNEYANLMTLGEVLMEMSWQMAEQLGEKFQWSLPFYKSFSANSPEIGQFV